MRMTATSLKSLSVTCPGGFLPGEFPSRVPFAEWKWCADHSRIVHRVPENGRAWKGLQTYNVVLNKLPYNPGHLLVVPLRRVGDLAEVTPGRRRASQALLQGSLVAIRAHVGSGRVQHRPQPRADRGRGDPRGTCTGTSFRVGAATPTSCPSWARPVCSRTARGNVRAA